MKPTRPQSRSRQREKVEQARLQVEALQKKLVDLDIIRAGLASSNAILEETAIALQAKRAQNSAQRAALKETPEPPLWDARTGRALASFANLLRTGRVAAELTATEAQKLTLEEVILLHQEFQQRLEEAVFSNDPELEPRIARLLRARTESRNAIAGMGAKASAALITELFPVEPPTQSQVTGGVALLALTADQVNEVVAACTKLARRRTQILKEREDILKGLQRVGEASHAGAGTTELPSEPLLDACNVEDDLRQNLEKQHQALCQFHNEFIETMTPMQLARSLVYAHRTGAKCYMMAEEVMRQQRATEPQSRYQVGEPPHPSSGPSSGGKPSGGPVDDISSHDNQPVVNTGINWGSILPFEAQQSLASFDGSSQQSSMDV